MSVMLLIVMAVVAVFVSVTGFCAPLPPTGTDAQLKLVGETVAANRLVAACSAPSTMIALRIFARLLLGRNVSLLVLEQKRLACEITGVNRKARRALHIAARIGRTTPEVFSILLPRIGRR